MFKRSAVLATLAVLAVGFAATAAVSSTGKQSRPGDLAKIDHIVVIYEENHSFDNLYGLWEGVNGIRQADGAHTIQVDQAGNPFPCLMQLDVNLTAPPNNATCGGVINGVSYGSPTYNGRFAIDPLVPATAATCPPPGAFAVNGFAAGKGVPGGCTRDIVHRYYQEQYQLDGGKQDRYTTGSDAVGLTQGFYITSDLPIYKYLHAKGHPSYAILDDFFQGAFGGSFLNHQVLIAAAAPKWPGGALNDGSANDLHSVVDASGMPNNYPAYVSPLGSAVKDTALTASCNPPAGRAPTPAGVTCGDYAVNTIQPGYQPYAPGTPDAKRLPPLTSPNIGDELTAKNVDWAWYSGGWSNADGDVGAPGWTNGSGPACSDPYALKTTAYPICPDADFQFHHQAFNYYANYAPGTAARKAHLQDEAAYSQLVASSTSSCGLKPVSFVKPIGEENEHPGYASESQGSDHLVSLLEAITASACAKDTMVVVTYDESGGQQDHVPPPGQGGAPGPHDQWGPGTRVPALVLAPGLKAPFVVDSTEHDTTSILATIEHRFGVAPLSTRDAQVPDLASALTATATKLH